MTTRAVLGSDGSTALVVKTDSPSPIDHIRMVSASPGITGAAKRASM